MAITTEDYYSKANSYKPNSKLLKTKGNANFAAYMAMYYSGTNQDKFLRGVNVPSDDIKRAKSDGYYSAEWLQSQKVRNSAISTVNTAVDWAKKWTKEWSDSELKTFLKTNFPTHIKELKDGTIKASSGTYTTVDFEKLDREQLDLITGFLTRVRYFDSGSASVDQRRGKEDDYSTQLDAFNKHRQIVKTLADKGGTAEQIEKLLSGTEDFDALDDYDDFIKNLNTAVGDGSKLLGENEWFRNLMKSSGVGSFGTTTTAGTTAGTTVGTTAGTTADTTAGTTVGTTATINDDGTQSFSLDDATVSVMDADTAAQSAQTAASNTVLGQSSLDALRKYASDNDYTLDENVGANTYTLKNADGNTVNTFAVDNDNNQIVYVGGEKAGQRFSVGGMPERVTEMQGVEDQAFADQQGLADELGVVSDEYDQYLTDTAAEFDELDFAGQINAQLNQFLTGKDADGNDILDGDGNPIKGFLDYQGDLEDAAGTYKEGVEGLATLYGEEYQKYADELSPIRDRMGDVSDRMGEVSAGQMQVAKDASDESYYNRLRDTLYADSQDQLNRQTEAGMDSIRQSFAASGADPTSPAFTAAMTDLQKSRADSMASARRQAILDSYGLGSQMLGNRSQALSGAGTALNSQMSGLSTEMNAVDSLYGVKLADLNNRQDMIGKIYGADKDIAGTGISGLNTVLNTNLQGIQANQDQFNTKLGLNKDLYNTQLQNLGLQFDAFGNIRNTANQEGRDAVDAILEFNQGKSSNKLVLETLKQYASENDNYSIDPALEEWLSK